MKNCEGCEHWQKLGASNMPRHVMYDSRAVMIPPGDEGLCRALPPNQDNRWPITMGTDVCGCHEPKTLTEETTPRADAAGETSKPPAPDSACAAQADGGKGSPPVKSAPASAAGGPPSLLSRVFPGRGHGRRSSGQ